MTVQHEPRSHRTNRGLHVACCSCGWHGEPRPTYGAATIDAARHRLDVARSISDAAQVGAPIVSRVLGTRRFGHR